MKMRVMSSNQTIKMLFKYTTFLNSTGNASTNIGLNRGYLQALIEEFEMHNGTTVSPTVADIPNVVDTVSSVIILGYI